MGDAAAGADLVTRLRAAPDSELAAILAAADAADIAMRQSSSHAADDLIRPAPGTVEIVLLGALGCRYGMLADGAGGHLVRTATTSVLVDPGPAALHMLVQLTRQRRFGWEELDAICVTHFHPDHYTDLIPCIEGMASHHQSERKLLVANPTTAERFTAFSPYHAGGMARVVTLAHPATEGDGEPTVTIGDLTIHATPAVHTEEAGRTRSAIGLVYQHTTGGIWYTSDTNLTNELLEAVAAIAPEPVVVIAHADASNIDQAPGRAEACHLETRDIPTIATQLSPRYVVIQHYDAAYSAPEYRIAQAIWLQRILARIGLPTRVAPSASGLRIGIANNRIIDHGVVLDTDAAAAVAAYLH